MAGAQLSFPEGFDPAADEGLVPCLLNGQAAAFEYEREAVAGGWLLSFIARASYASFAACACVAASMAALGVGRVLDDDDRERDDADLQLRLGKVPAGAHLARRLVESVPVDQVPPALRAPNSRFVIVLRDACEIVAIEAVASR